LSWWREFFDDRGTDAYIQRVRTIQDQMLAAGKGSFKTVQSSSDTPEAEVYSVSCGGKTFVYVYNPTKRAITPVVYVEGSTAKTMKVYDCESGGYTDAKLLHAASQLQIKGIELAPNTDKVFIF